MFFRIGRCVEETLLLTLLKGLLVLVDVKHLDAARPSQHVCSA